MVAAARIGAFANRWISGRPVRRGCYTWLRRRGWRGRRTLWPIRRWRALNRRLTSRFRWLCRIGAKKSILQRRSVKPPDNGIHLLLIGRFDKSEALRLLGLRVADNLDRVCDQVFGRQPRFDIVGRHPNREISEKNGKAHEIVVLCSVKEVRGAPCKRKLAQAIRILTQG
jgi:hypothetical protein